MSALGWLTVDGAEVTDGVSMPDADMLPSIVNVNMDAAGLAPGTYTADILISSSDAGNPTTTVPVTMNVMAGYTLSGDVTYASGTFIYLPLEGCSVELRDASDAVLFSTTTDVDGNYEFTGLLDGDYTVQTSSSQAYSYITDVGDANVVIDHVLSTPLTGIFFLAGDVDGNLTIDVSDVNLMIDNILGTVVGYPIADWLFEVQTVNISGAAAVVNYQGIMASDADGSWDGVE